MAERIVSPGVFTREVDQSFLPAGLAAIGAAVIGPTAKGPAGIPTVVTSYSDYLQKFGGTITSGSGAVQGSYKYLTNYMAQEYLKYADTLTVVRILAGGYGPASAAVTCSGVNANAFSLYTLSDGADQNSSGSEGSNNTLTAGTVNNLRWEITGVNNTKGTFTLLIRRGDDTGKRKIILEQYNNLTLDPNSNNYIAKVIGDQVYTMRDSGTTDPFLQLSGSYANRSNFVRVEVSRTTYNYLDANGNIRDNALSASLPAAVSGTFSGGSDGNVVHPIQFYDEITNTNTQGFNLGQPASGSTSYTDAIFLLKNQDEYDINLLALPGLVDNFSNHSAILTTALTAMEDRSDAFLLIDPVEYGASIGQATAKAESRDTNYAATYWPWVKIPDVDLGRNVWVPASTLIPSVYAFNDRVAAPWYAPAGLNRGALDIAVQTERKLTQSNRDTLYESAVNPIATFPNAGVNSVTLSATNACTTTTKVKQVLITGITKHTSQLNFSSYFNENTLYLNGLNEGAYNLQITSIDGKSVYNKTLNSNASEQKVLINDLPQGMYIIKLSNTKQSGNNKILIN